MSPRWYRARRGPRRGGGWLAAALVLGASEARADEKAPFFIGEKPAWFLMGGATGGVTAVASEGGGYAGGELSLVRLSEAKFFGFYGDGYRDFGARRSYTTAGVELGYRYVGIDAGAAARLGSGRVEWGATGRVFATVGLVSLYGRYAYFADVTGGGHEHVVQIGGLVKVPIATWGF